MAVLGEIKCEHVQEFIKACIIIDRFPMRSDANSSKGLTSSKDVRRKPCPEGMSEADFVEVRLLFYILLDENVSAHANDCVHLSAVQVNTHTNCRVHNTHTHTRRHKRHGHHCSGTVNTFPRNIPPARQNF